MEVKRKLKPGEPGTLRLLQEYGNKLICVRYRYDKLQHKRQTTIELIIDEQPWYGSIKPVSPRPKVTPQTRMVYVRVLYNETELRLRVKNAGGAWDTKKQLWFISQQQAQNLGLEDRIVVQ